METLICVITIPCTFWPTLASDLGFLVLNRQSDRFTRIKQDDVDLLDWFPTKQFACLHQLLLQYNSWFSVLRPQAEWIFRSVRQRSRGDLHFVAVNLANSKALNLVPFLQWHLLGTWSIAPPNHPMMPWPSMAYKTQFLHLNGHNFGHIHKFCPYHSYIMFFHLQYIYIPWHSSSPPYPHISCWVIHSRCAATAAPCTYPDPYPTDWWSKGHRALTRCWRRHRTSTGFNGSIVRKFVGENGKAKEAQNWGSARSADSRCPTISHD